MRIQVLTIFAAAVLLTACGASKDPILQNRVAEAFNTSSSASYDAGGVFEKAMPYAVGQYVVHGTKDGDDHGVVRTAIVGREGDAFIIETASLTESGESFMQMAVSGMEQARESMNPDDIDVKWVKMKAGKDEEVQKIDGIALSMSKSMYAKGLSGVVVNFENAGGTAVVRVPAGTFNGCTKATATVETFIKDFESEGYYHPSVPLNGMVRSISKDDDTVTELLEFGLRGAKPSF